MTSTKRTTTAAKNPPPKAEKGTERWPANAVEPGEFIQVPKVLLKRFSAFELEPRHLWLLLMLQSDRYRDRAPRYYWAELAKAAGKGTSTVRTWAYELKDKGLLGIKPTRKLSPGEEARPGHRNERNQFLLEKFERRVEAEQTAWEAERTARRARAELGKTKRKGKPPAGN